MLFDLKGKRRRTVQVTYVILAVLMGGGLVLFGIGSSGSGGLIDAITGGGGDDSGNGNEVIEKRIDKAEKQLKANPKDQAALKVLIRSNYNVAQADFNDQTNKYGKDGKADLQQSVSAWKKYVALEPKTVDPSLVSTVAQAYIALEQPAEAAKAVELTIDDRADPQAYLQLVQLWTLAGNTRRADLAGKKAVILAPKAQRKAVEAAVAQAKTPPSAQGQNQQGAPDPGGVKAK